MNIRILKLKKFLQDRFERPIQAFTTRSLVKDYVYEIYSDDNINIDYAPGYNYIEIFGITDEEFNYLEKNKVIY